MKHYRKEAIKKTGSPEKLDQLIHITAPQNWLVMAALTLLICLSVLWGIYGTITTQATGQGILLAHNGSIFAAMANAKGQIKKISIQVGQQVEKNQILALLDRPDLTNQITALKSRITVLKKSENELILDIKHLTELTNRFVKREQKKLDEIVAFQKERLAYLKKHLPQKKINKAQGVLSEDEYENERKKYHELIEKVNENFSRHIQSMISENALVTERRQDLFEIRSEIFRQEQILKNLEIELDLAAKIISPAAGVISAIHANKGQILISGETFASIASTGDEIDAVAFFKAHQGLKINKNMAARIEPAHVDKNEFGMIYGSVTEVTDFPVSKKSMLTLLQNQHLVDNLSKENNLVLVRIKLQKDPQTISGFKWTSKTGPKHKIKIGTLCKAEVIIREQPPITLIIPGLKALFGLQ